MLDVCLLGSGGMMPLPYRWLTALMTRYNGSSLLIDCGEGTQIAIKEKGWSFKPINVICFTHFHGDHISGLPGLLLTMGNAERTEPLTLIGPKGLERVVTALRVIAPELPFPIHFIELTKAEEELSIGGYRIKAFRVNHNVTCYGYSLEIDRAGKFQLERALELGIPKNFWNRLQKGETVEADGRYIRRTWSWALRERESSWSTVRIPGLQPPLRPTRWERIFLSARACTVRRTSRPRQWQINI